MIFGFLTGVYLRLVPIPQIAEANKNAHREVSASAWLGIATALRTFGDKLREDRSLRSLAALFELDGELLAC